MVGKESGIDVIIEIDAEPQVPFGNHDLFIGVGQSPVTIAFLTAYVSFLQMNVFRRDPQGRGDNVPHQWQPFRRRLFAHIFRNDQMSGIPVDGSPDFRNVPVVEPEHLDVLPGKTLAQMGMAFFYPVGEHIRLVAVFSRQIRILHRCKLLLRQYPGSFPHVTADGHLLGAALFRI